MKRIINYGSLTAIIVKDADGENVYVQNNITKSEHLFARILNNDPVMDMEIALDKIESSAKSLNENFKQL